MYMYMFGHCLVMWFELSRLAGKPVYAHDHIKPQDKPTFGPGSPAGPTYPGSPRGP